MKYLKLFYANCLYTCLRVGMMPCPKLLEGNLWMFMDVCLFCVVCLIIQCSVVYFVCGSFSVCFNIVFLREVVQFKHMFLYLIRRVLWLYKIMLSTSTSIFILPPLKDLTGTIVKFLPQEDMKL